MSKANNTGMSMMLKALGLDPEEITKTIGSIGGAVVEMKAQADRIEAKLDAIQKQLGLSVTEKEETQND